jgi:hypothetical protein
MKANNMQLPYEISSIAKPMTNRTKPWSSFFLALIAVMLLSTGCVTNGRRVLLKEYGPSVPESAGGKLQGVTICVKEFTSAPDLMALETKLKPEEPLPFKYTKQTREEDQAWSKEMKALKKQTPKKAELAKIGNMRNGFGMVLSHIYALNDPAAWLTESLKYDLEAQGAKVVGPSEEANADVSVSGILQMCRADMYVVVDGNLFIDLEVQPKTGQARRRQVYTHGATAAMLASEGEYFHAFRDARQKFSIITAREIVAAVNPAP